MIAALARPLRTSPERRLFAPEVVQTSAMDCGPAALKCLLDGHGLPVSYGRLREACQTSVDGTSIDTIEDVAQQLGLSAEQVLVPRDFILLGARTALPAIVVVRHAENATHFVVVWAQHGPWLQIMDPAVGRRWIRRDRFEREVFAHHTSVDARDWRAWCDTIEYREAMQARLAALGFAPGEAVAITEEAAREPGWFGFGALDASLRLAASLCAAGGLENGEEASRVTRALFRDTCASGHHIFAVIPPGYWSVQPDLSNTDPTRQMLRVSGAVVLRTGGRMAPADQAALADLPPELAAAVTAGDDHGGWRTAWALLRQDRSFSTPMIAGAIVLQALAVLLEGLLFRAFLEISLHLALEWQRIAALALLAGFAALLAMLDLGVTGACMRLGRDFEVRLRQALLAKLPRLHDRYFQSRPITDMANRSHNLHIVRSLPAMAFGGLQAACDLVLTFVAVAIVAPACAGWALAVVATGFVLPALAQPMLGERDLAMRSHAGALHGFLLDALLGIAPIRAHRAESAVARQHEGLLVEWARAATVLTRLSLGAQGAQGLIATALVGAMLLSHFAAQGAVHGSDLLLVFWALKLPGSADRLAGMARGWPPIRNALLSQLEPLTAPEDEGGRDDAAEARPVPAGAAAITLRGGSVVAGGHPILAGIDLTIAPGEHIAIVGRSGAGKSSLIGLLLGWHRLAAGELLVDGAPLAGEALTALRQRSAWVDPQVQLWNRSLLDNLTYSVEPGQLGPVRDLIEASGLMGVTGRLPQGLQTALGEGGGLLSGGEGQRVRLGRALMTDAARLVLLDEPFRGLDRVQRRAQLARARDWWREATLLCVTHDIAETQAFDRVLVIEDGRIVEDGAPASLAARATRYRALLDAERRMTREIWGAAAWRRLTIAGGKVREALAA